MENNKTRKKRQDEWNKRRINEINKKNQTRRNKEAEDKQLLDELNQLEAEEADKKNTNTNNEKSLQSSPPQPNDDASIEEEYNQLVSEAEAEAKAKAQRINDGVAKSKEKAKSLINNAKRDFSDLTGKYEDTENEELFKPMTKVIEPELFNKLVGPISEHVSNQPESELESNQPDFENSSLNSIEVKNDCDFVAECIEINGINDNDALNKCLKSKDRQRKIPKRDENTLEDIINNCKTTINLNGLGSPHVDELLRRQSENPPLEEDNNLNQSSNQENDELIPEDQSIIFNSDTEPNDERKRKIAENLILFERILENYQSEGMFVRQVMTTKQYIKKLEEDLRQLANSNIESREAFDYHINVLHDRVQEMSEYINEQNELNNRLYNENNGLIDDINHINININLGNDLQAQMEVLLKEEELKYPEERRKMVRFNILNEEDNRSQSEEEELNELRSEMFIKKKNNIIGCDDILFKRKIAWIKWHISAIKYNDALKEKKSADYLLVLKRQFKNHKLEFNALSNPDNDKLSSSFKNAVYNAIKIFNNFEKDEKDKGLRIVKSDDDDNSNISRNNYIIKVIEKIMEFPELNKKNDCISVPKPDNTDHDINITYMNSNGKEITTDNTYLYNLIMKTICEFNASNGVRQENSIIPGKTKDVSSGEKYNPSQLQQIIINVLQFTLDNYKNKLSNISSKILRGGKTLKRYK